MAQEYVAGVGGQISNPSRLTGRKGLRRVVNCVLDRPGVLKPRRGFSAIDDLTDADRIHRLWDFDQSLMAHWDDAGSYRVSWYASGTGTWTSLSGGDRAAPTGRRMAVAEAAGNLYLTSQDGVLKLDALTSALVVAGAPTAPGFDRANSTLTDDNAGILLPQTAAAYRSCFYRRDANGNLIQGAPSGRMVLRNENAVSGGSNQIPVVRALIPAQNGTASTALTTDWFLQVYRSNASADLATPPPDEERLVYEAPLTSAQITAGYVDVTDVTPDDLQGETIYTAATRGGITQANTPPPYAGEVVAWKNCLVYLNTVSRQRFELQILAVDGTNGIKATNTITFAGASNFTLTAVTTTPSTDEYQLATGGSLSASQEIELTAQNLVAAINESANNSIIYAYYVGVPSDPRSLGRIVLESRTALDDFFVYVGTGSVRDCFEPQLPETNPSTNVASTADEWPDGWALSKVGQPEAVPLLNTGRLGGGETILRGVVLGESLFLFTDRGIWRMSGEPPAGAGDPGSIRVDPWRTTVHTIASQTVRALGGNIYALTNQGVVAISESGVRVVSWDIEPDLAAIFGRLTGGAKPGNALLEDYAFAVAYESDRKYLLMMPYSTSDTQATKFFCYDHLQDGWTEWEFSGESAARSCGHVHRAEDKLYLARNDSTQSTIYQERKDYAASDHQDDGDTAISISVRWWPLLGSNAGRKKFWRELALLFESGMPSSVALSITSDYVTKTATIAKVSNTIARTWVPQSVRRAARLDVTVTWSVTGATFELSALSALYRDYEGRLTK